MLSCTQADGPATDAIQRQAERAAPALAYHASGRAQHVALEAAVVTAAVSLPAIRASDSAAMIIRRANATLEVDSLETAVAAIRRLAARVGGYVANSTMQTGRGQLRSATLALKIPASRVDDALSGLAPIGKLESVDVSAEDVGEEYVDVAARTDNARRLERRLIELLATRTGKLKDVLDVEQALARVREEIERYEGRRRYLRAHVATSTLSLHAHEPLPIVGSAGSSVMGEAFKQAWRNFVALLALLVQSLGVVVPLGTLAVLIWTGARRYRRLVSHRAG